MRRNTSNLSQAQEGELNLELILVHHREAIAALAEATQDSVLKWLKTNPDLVI